MRSSRRSLEGASCAATRSRSARAAPDAVSRAGRLHRPGRRRTARVQYSARPHDSGATLVRASIALLSLALAANVAACAQLEPDPGDDVYQPRFGQPGKNVVWIPTP